MEQNNTQPVVTVRVPGGTGEEFDITYACTIDHDKQNIELPSNLPGGSEVYVDGEYLCTTAVPLGERAARMKNMRKTSMRPSLLAVAIGAALYN